MAGQDLLAGLRRPIPPGPAPSCSRRLSPYWRPTAYASAIVVADALVWEGADSRILDLVSHLDDFGQYLIRAFIFRAVTDWLLAGNAPAGSPGEPWAPAVDLACQLAGRG